MSTGVVWLLMALPPCLAFSALNSSGQVGPSEADTGCKKKGEKDCAQCFPFKYWPQKFSIKTSTFQCPLPDDEDHWHIGQTFRGESITTATTSKIELVTFDFDGTTELYDLLAHDVIDAAQIILNANPGTPDGDKFPCAKVPDGQMPAEELEMLVEDHKKHVLAVRALVMYQTANFADASLAQSAAADAATKQEKAWEKRKLKTESKTCMGTQECIKNKACVITVADAMKQALTKIVANTPALIEKYFGGENVRWTKYKKAFSALQDAKGKEKVGFLSASWSPVPGAAWKLYLEHLVQEIGLTVAAENILGIDDPGPGLSAQKGEAFAAFATARGVPMENAIHVDNGDKYAKQAAEVGGLGLWVWGATAKDIALLADAEVNKYDTWTVLKENRGV